MKTASRENSDVNTDKIEQNQQLIHLLQPDAVHMFLDDERSCATDVFDSPVFIAVAGGTASGKTSFCEKVIEYLDRHRIAQPGQVVIITQDCFYRNLTPEEQNLAAHSDFDFDSPGAFDFALMRTILQKLQSGRKVRIPQYDFKTNSRCEGQWTEIGRVDVVILEGIFALYDEDINKLMSLKLFVESDSDTRLARRIKRDIIERGRKLEGVLTQYMRFVKEAFDKYVNPTRRNADLIVLHGKENKVAIKLICAQIAQILSERHNPVESPFPNNEQYSPPLIIGLIN
ncbi:MAG: uridine kinase [Streblomastix strix]|uniref:uridine/cytidine kinase n=1 Tax=Streblomastix strix TaxID=222440 RepID=A0A5J4WEP2_9EUKA|nr:MAG: uridine kinase [Streblomastix strix]